MSKSLSEKQVLAKLGIPDFRHMSKENVMSFASMIKDMDPEVAMKAIEQFPEFANVTLSALKDYQSVLNQALEDDKNSSAQCFHIYNNIQDALCKCLEEDDLSFEEKRFYIEQLKEIADMATQKDTEGKKYRIIILSVGGIFVLSTISVVASLLGGKTNLKLPFSRH